MEASEGISGQTLAELRNALVWFLEVSVAVVFGLSGLLKISKPIEYLDSLGMDSVMALPEWAVRTVGTVELLSASALLVPAMLGVLVSLAPLAITALLAAQAFAIILELSLAQGDFALTMNIVLLGCLAVVAWHRLQAVR
ncbi:DoxX family protein [Rhizobium rhizogenes]|uniref:DoxX family protein n=1 Tax=Rhizobium rhizogenes TaxID=359 RepID=UPI000ACF043A|nr:DoxX family protein [Rhizobium rhizogenes]